MTLPSGRPDKITIVSMAVLASAAATFLHEGIGHGLTAWIRGDVPTELTSNHLSSLRPDRWVDAAGTLANLFAGSFSLWASQKSGRRANLRYFLWIFAALNLLPGAGYFLFSGVFGFGDWQEVIRGWPHQILLRTLMVLFGAILYTAVVQLLAVAVSPFCPHRDAYNTVGRLPYYAACLFSCVAGALDPLGLTLFLISTVPAAFGGSSGLMWADALMRGAFRSQLTVKRDRKWWLCASVVGLSYILLLGRGIKLSR